MYYSSYCSGLQNTNARPTKHSLMHHFVASYVVIVAGDELVLVGDQLHLMLHPKMVSQVVAVPKDFGATELKEKLDLRCKYVFSILLSLHFETQNNFILAVLYYILPFIDILST